MDIGWHPAGQAKAEEIGAVFAPTDVTSADDVTSALDNLASFAGGEVNSVVNCAGIGIAMVRSSVA